MTNNENQNPYESPQQFDTDSTIDQLDSVLLAEPNKCSAGAGLTWFTDAFKIFKQEWLLWIGITCTFIFLFLLLNMIPLVNIIGSFLTFHFIGGMLIGCHQQVEHNNLKFSHLFSGFESHFVPLLILYLLYLIMMIIAMIPLIILMVYLFGSALLGSGSFESLMSSQGLLMIALVALISMALVIPALMAIWFAPALIVIHDVEPATAIKMSFNGCLKNMIPFLVYGLVVPILSLLFIVLTLGLGLFVLLPIFYITYYTSYLAVWTDEEIVFD